MQMLEVKKVGGGPSEVQVEAGVEVKREKQDRPLGVEHFPYSSLPSSIPFFFLNIQRGKACLEFFPFGFANFCRCRWW